MDTTIKSNELTDREFEVLKNICLSTSELTKKMNISANTLKSFKVMLRKKLNAADDTQILANALKRGVVSLDEIVIVEIKRD